MRNDLLRFNAILVFTLFSVTVFSQTPVTISGNVHNAVSKEKVPAVSVTIKGSTAGTYTDDRGNFRLTTNRQLPFVLVFSSIGFETQEVTVSSAAAPVNIDFVPASSLGREVVVSATRSAIRSLESPVSIERMGSTAAHEAGGPNFYDAIANLKGGDAVTSSLLFKTIGTRGFKGSGDIPRNQFVDGMGKQA